MRLFSRFISVLLAGLIALPVEAQSSGDSFTAPALEAPPLEESGPLQKKQLTFGPDPQTEEPDAQAPDQDTTTPASVPAAPEIRSQVDGLFRALVSGAQIPGAAVAIIQDGAVTHKAGYGYADIRTRTPVDPDITRFRVASVSKLVTATAVMQLVEQGSVDLNADINTYLTAFRIGGDYPVPVTIANLLTHTGGFDDRYLGMAAPMGAPPETLAQHLARAMPQRVLAPRSVIAYSNYGIALAGHIVESVSGEEFGAYASMRMLQPLGMTSSSFGIPYPLPPTMATPHFRSSGGDGFRTGSFDISRIAPAGDLVTTAADMARFMRAHLDNENSALLSQPTMEQMHARHFANADGLDGWAYGFATGRRNGITWIGHDGSWNGFCAQLVMHPESRSGYFAVYNTECSFAASQAIRSGLFDALWPAGPSAAPPAVGDEARARAAEGTYMHVRRARADFTVVGAAASAITVAAQPGGALKVTMPSIGRDLTFLPQADGTWLNPELQLKAAVPKSGNGRFFIEASAYDRVTGLASWAMWTVALALVIAICIMTMWGWANGFLSRHLFGEPQAVITFGPRITGFLAAGLVVATLLSMTALLSDSAPFAILHGPTPMLMVLLTVPVVVAILSIPMIVWSVTGFGTDPRARLAQAGYVVLTLGILTFVAFCLQWGFHIFAVLGR
jgi:CubicO group peptidase (beta-lactamase class C family)